MTKFFECYCYSPEHTLKFSYDEIDKELYTEIFLCQYRNFIKRAWVAIKYVFGYKCKYGHFCCFTFKDADLPQFRDMLIEITKKNN
jgi:hypothetical protein